MNSTLNSRCMLSSLYKGQEYFGMFWIDWRAPILQKKLNFEQTQPHKKVIQSTKDGEIIKIDQMIKMTREIAIENYYCWICNLAKYMDQKKQIKQIDIQIYERDKNKFGQRNNKCRNFYSIQVSKQLQEKVTQFQHFPSQQQLNWFKNYRLNNLYKYSSTKPVFKMSSGSLKEQHKHNDIQNEKLGKSYDKKLIYNGEYNTNGIKIGKWDILYEGQYIGGGSFDNFLGIKIGQWTELWNDMISITYKGDYNLKGVKTGRWTIVLDGQQIGGGSYDDFSGIKIGKWVELDEKFYEQGRQLTYTGEYSLNGAKIGKWDILYDGQYIGGGSFDNFLGIKIGQWTELWNDMISITYKGDYNLKGVKTGRWIIVQDGQQIGGGSYDDFSGIKIGKWVELDEKFYEQGRQLTYTGEYSLNGVKIGKWDILYDGQYIGGGSFDNFLGIKIGQWTELRNDMISITYKGDYNLKGVKTGRWTIVQDGQQIGGGSYDDFSGIKIGKWVELDEKFNTIEMKLTYEGEYNTKGTKIGRWDTLYNRKQIGGGSYNGVGIKVGKWVEVDQKYTNNNQLSYEGEYNIQGKKEGRWDAIYEIKDDEDDEVHNIFVCGGGSYDGSLGTKIGKWVELDENFHHNYERFELSNQLTYNGEYNNMGIKIGRWDTMFKEKYSKQYKQIGGGSYQGSLEIKVGKWVELDESYNEQVRKLIYEGEYNMKGLKTGRWDILYYGQQIGGGSYDDFSGTKIGKWIDLWNNHTSLTTNGEYNMMGIKIGRWVIRNCKDISNRQKKEAQYKQIGVGSYDSTSGIKIGKWVELDQDFYGKGKELKYVGEYNKKGWKVGRWDIMFKEWHQKEFLQIGGGSYDNSQQIKIGMWIDLKDGFNEWYQIIFKGEYNKMGMKIGRWDILQRLWKESKFKQIGGGSYDCTTGLKTGSWIEVQNSQKISQGEYNTNGMKVGTWINMEYDNKNEIFQKIKEIRI